MKLNALRYKKMKNERTRKIWKTREKEIDHNNAILNALVKNDY